MKATKHRIRRAELTDAPAIAELMCQLGYPTTEEEMTPRLRTILGRDDFITLVACDGALTFGVIGAQLCPGYNRDGLTGRIATLVVDRHRREHGVGCDLVRRLESALDRLGATGVFVNSRTHRAEAHRFYENLGYAENGKRMVRNLSQPPPRRKLPGKETS